MNVAASVRQQKEKHPELFCAHPKCLWRIVTHAGPNPCKNHPVPAPTPAQPRRCECPFLLRNVARHAPSCPEYVPFYHTSDGAYHADDGDRRDHQRTLDEKAARQAERVARAGAARQQAAD